MSVENVLVTGASSGIGLEISKVFARNGSNLVIVARREEKLNEIAEELNAKYGIEVRVLAKDLSKPKSAAEIFNELKRDNHIIDVLVNNAGFGAIGNFYELDHEMQVDMVSLNSVALTSLTRLFLPGMIERNRGGILNVGSLAGFQPGPNATVYYATKAYVLSFTEALAEELKGTKVKVSCLAPGPVATEFGEISGIDKTVLFKFGTQSSSEVAQKGYDGFREGKIITIPSISSSLLPVLVRFSPRFLVRKVTKKLNSV